MRNAWEETHVACSRHSDGGDQVNFYTASAKKKTRGKKLGEMGRSEGIANFLPAPN